jgi:predicted HTH transcriptional regulator
VPDIQHQINQRIESFVSEITELARLHALETLSAALEGSPLKARLRRGSSNHAAKGAKRSPLEIQATTSQLLSHIQGNPGMRMEQIAQSVGLSTKDLSLPIRKLVRLKKVKTEGQKRATRYFPAGASAGAGAAAGTRGRRGVRRKGKKSR